MKPLSSAFACVLALTLGLGACGTRIETAARFDDGRQATSLLGEPLFTVPTSESEKPVLVEAYDALHAAPTNPDAIIWYGRRLAQVGYYREAVRAFSYGLELYPANYRLLRFRGHRFITLREFEHAIDDLEAAWKGASGCPDLYEPNTMPTSLPNPQRPGFPVNSGPRSTDHGNIVYHLGLAHYLRGEYEQAVEWFSKRRSLALSNDDMTVASVSWEYLSLMRLGRADEATQLLSEIGPGMDVRENRHYYTVLALYKGVLSVDQVLSAEDPSTDPWTIAHGPPELTQLYGVAAYLDTVVGDHDRATTVYERILERSRTWASFGFIAAEADVARARRRE